MLRLDRITTLYFFGLLRRNSRPSGLPILMYHGITDAAESKGRPYYWTNTAPRLFREHMQFLKEQGYSTIHLHAAARRIRNQYRTDEKVAVITFDDGYENFYKEAFPVLNRLGFTADVFLPTASIGDTNLKFNGMKCLTWSQVRELKQAGISFGSHSATHPVLTRLSAGQVRNEVRASKDIIEQKLGCVADTFSYPYAFPAASPAFIADLRDLLCEAGYQSGVTTTIGTADHSCDPYFLKRLPVNSGDDLAFFKAKLGGAYNWLQVLQKTHKRRAGRAASRRSISGAERQEPANS
jgi:peptidoglycan/xylan/chitin deacetylase (PgdA/CDA1 family)